jgi:hypothetical protein
VGYVFKWPQCAHASCSKDCFILWSKTLNSFSGLCFELVLVVELCFNGLCFVWVSLVKLGFSCLCFEWGSMVELGFSALCFSALYFTFQVETWVDLRWCSHSDLCEVNVVYLRQLHVFQRLLYHVSSALFDCSKIWANTNIFLCIWHVRKVWQKQMCIKIKDVVVRTKGLKNMWCIMHDTT